MRSISSCFLSICAFGKHITAGGLGPTFGKESANCYCVIFPVMVEQSVIWCLGFHISVGFLIKIWKNNHIDGMCIGSTGCKACLFIWGHRAGYMGGIGAVAC